MATDHTDDIRALPNFGNRVVGDSAHGLLRTGADGEGVHHQNGAANYAQPEGVLNGLCDGFLGGRSVGDLTHIVPVALLWIFAFSTHTPNLAYRMVRVKSGVAN